MKYLSAIFLLFLSLNVFAQKPDEILAMANGRNYTAEDLVPQVRQALANLPTTLSDTRQALLEQQIAEMLFEKEAAARKITVEKLIEKEVKSKVPSPTEKEIQAVYNANREQIGSQTLDEVRPQIVAFLKGEPERKALAEFISDLKVKYKVALGKDVNAANLNRFEVLATVGDQQITVENYDAKNKATLAEIEAGVYDQVRASLEQIVFSNLIVAEAKAQNMEASDFIAREITDKLKDYSDAERARLESDLREKLFKKYGTKFTVKEIPPLVQNVSTDNQPSRGRIDAPVTVVMFSDFQCSHCAAVHPVLQKVLAEYPSDKVHFVVRDFPLETIHENAYHAALASNAANAQGKFFEYTELLYKNQDKLDDESLKKYAAQIGLNQKQFDLDLESEKYAADVRRDLADGKSYGITGTPTVFVNGIKVRDFSPEGFRKAIEKALKNKSENTK